MDDKGSKRRTVHGEQRHREGTRPTAYAFQDRNAPEEVYEQDDGRMVYVGKRGRVHIFEKNFHHTSFRMSARAREERVRQGRWRRIY